MTNAFTIMRRELSAYFKSPIGYIFMIVFVAISVGLYITAFFIAPTADMRSYFGNLPILLCVFIPAVTMRVWAEERKENTWELLLTFPMKAWELVIGKFLACLVFFALTLAATFTVPAMLIKLGDPDMGAITAGYFGTFLLGAYFLAIGIFFSGFYKDQIISFVVTLLVCFSIFLIGTGFIAAYVDGMFVDTWLAGFGSLLSELVGLTAHYGAFTRGVVEIADILYFVAWTTVFLVLNILYIDGRSRAGARLYFSVAVTICIAIGFLGNWLITDTSLGRFDVTEDKIFTISDASKRILSDVDTTVQVKYYVTPKSEMPTGMTTLQQDVVDKLDELRVASGGKIQYQVVNMNVQNVIAAQNAEEDPEDKEAALEERMLEKGVQPFSVQAMSDDQFTNKLVYSSLGIGYKAKEEEIIPGVMPAMLQELEYRLVSTIYKLTREDKPVVALVAPTEAVTIDPQMRRMLQQMGQPIPQTDDPYEFLEQLLASEKYEVQRVELSPTSPMPEEYDTLVIINPRAFNERHQWEINRALRSGKSVVLAVQTYEWDYVPQGRSVMVTTRKENPGVNDLLAAYGLWVSEKVLMDTTQQPLTVSSGNALQSMLGGGITLSLPTQMLVNGDSMDKDTSITSRLSSIFYLWGTAVELNVGAMKENGLESRVLMTSTPDAWEIENPTQVTDATFDPPTQGRQEYALMAMVSGQFPDAFEGQERPSWPVPPPQPGQPPQPPPPSEGPAGAITPAPGKLVIMGCSEMFRKNFLRQPGHIDLFLNSIDAITLGDDLVNVRGRKPIDRAITPPDSGTKKFWKFVNYGLATAIIAGVGIVTTTLRRRSRNAYTMSFSTND